MKTVIELTREAGGFDATPKFLERFAELVRADQSKPLTDEQIAETYASIGGLDFYLNFYRSFARAIEAAHNIKE